MIERLTEREQEVKDRIEWARERGFRNTEERERAKLEGFQEAVEIMRTAAPSAPHDRTQTAPPVLLAPESEVEDRRTQWLREMADKEAATGGSISVGGLASDAGLLAAPEEVEE